MREMRDTSDGPLVGVWNRQDKLIGIRKRSTPPDFDDLASSVYMSLEGVAIHVYGNSFGVSPGLACTSGLEYFKRLQARWGSAAPLNYAVSGSGLYEVCYDLNGVWTAGTGASVAGSAFGVARKGVVLLNALTNMYTNPDAAGAVQAVSGDYLTWLKYACRSIFATIGAGTRIESSAATAVGVWNTFANNHYSGGSTRYSVGQNDYLEFTGVTVPDGIDSVWVMVGITDDASVFEVSVDGVVQEAFVHPATKPTVRSYRHGNFATPVVGPKAGSPLYSFPVFTKVKAAPGVHNIRVKKTDAGAGSITVDGLIVPSVSPVQVVTFLDPLPAKTGARPEVVGRVQFAANKALIDQIYRDVCAEFAYVSLVDCSDLLDVGGVNVPDGLHPNDLGMLCYVNRVEASLSGITPRAGLFTTA